MTKMKLGWMISGGFSHEKVVIAKVVNSAGKPLGGIWLSPLTATGSEWTDFCEKEEMYSFLRNHTLHEVEVETKGLYRFRSKPTNKKIEMILSDKTRTGFYVPAVYDSWDVPTIWMKDASMLTFLEKKELAS